MSVNISAAMTVALPLPKMVDVGGVSGSFSELKLQTIQIVEGVVYLSMAPGNALSLNPAAGTMSLDSMRSETVDAIRTAVTMIGEDWVSGIEG